MCSLMFEEVVDEICMHYCLYSSVILNVEIYMINVEWLTSA